MSPIAIEDCFLDSATAKELYRNYAHQFPIIDFHTHLSPKAYVENHAFSDIADAWVSSDPYKWRAMRIRGVPERMITGASSAEEKFNAWAQTFPYLVGNPLFDWAKLELAKFFGISETLSSSNAASIWSRCNERLAQDDLKPQALLAGSGVETFVTSDSWLDPLDSHHQAKVNGLQPQMLPSLRADDAFAFTKSGFADWLERLGQQTDTKVNSLSAFQTALYQRLNDFGAAGCVMSDHGIDVLRFASCSAAEAEVYFKKVVDQLSLSDLELAKLSTFLLLWLAGEYTERGWTMQLHLGAQRQTSSHLADSVSKPGGYAIMHASVDDEALVSLLDAMESGLGLPRTILYSLSTNDYEWMSCLSGSFVEAGKPAKVQFGPAWWYNDHNDGIERQLHAIASYGVLHDFIGMNTDSRSFLSSVRHDYFRRILCNIFAKWVEMGRMPFDSVEPYMRAICYQNAKQYLKV